MFLDFVPLSQCLCPLHRYINRIRHIQQTHVVAASCQDSPSCHPPLSSHPHDFTLPLSPALWLIQPNISEGGLLHQRQREAEEEGRITPFDGTLDSDQIKPNMKLQSQNTQNKCKKLKWPSLLPHSKNLLQEISLAFH